MTDKFAGKNAQIPNACNLKKPFSIKENF